MRTLLIFFIIFVLFPIQTFALGHPGEQTGDGETLGAADPFGQDTAQAVLDSGSGEVAGTLSSPVDLTLQNGQDVSVNGDVSILDRSITATQLETDEGSFENVQDFVGLEDGGFTAESVDLLDFLTFLLTNAQGVSFSDGVLKADSADSLTKDNSVTTEILGLEIDTSLPSFHVDEAEDLVARGVTVSDIEDATFTITPDSIIMEASPSTIVDIEDKDFIKTTFDADKDDSIAIIKTDDNEILIKEGKLNFSNDEIVESVETNNTAKIELNPFIEGFECVTLTPTGNYTYHVPDNLRTDFAIHVPENGSLNKLCLRKSPDQSLTEFDSLVDFVDNKVTVNKIIHYLKYPFKDNFAHDVIFNSLLFDQDHYQAELQLDGDFALTRTLQLQPSSQSQMSIIEDLAFHKTKSTLKPNNIITINEQLVLTEVHRLVHVNAEIEDDTQYRVQTYQTSYFTPNIQMSNQILQQRSDVNTITVLPPHHQSINQLIQ